MNKEKKEKLNIKKNLLFKKKDTMEPLTTILASVILVLIVSKIIAWLMNYKSTLNQYRQIKGLPIIPLIGNLHQIGNNGADVLKKLIELSIQFKEEPFFIFYKSVTPIIVFHRADYVDVIILFILSFFFIHVINGLFFKAFFSKNSNDHKSIEYETLRPWLKDGLLMRY